MGLHTYIVKWNGKEISVKAKKDTAERFGYQLRDLLRIRNFTRRLTGIIGVTEGWDKEDSSVSMLLGGVSSIPLPDPEGYAKDLAEFTAEIPTIIADDKGGALGIWVMKAHNLLKKHMAVEDARRTPAQHAEDVTKQQADNKEREAAREVKDKEGALEADRIRKEYPNLATIVASGKSSYACGSANLKSELERAFPGIVFSVKSKGFSMGSDISVNWTDGPTLSQVKELSEKYQQGHFDGMNDSYNYKKEDFTRNFGGAKYVFETRTETDELVLSVANGFDYLLNITSVDQIPEDLKFHVRKSVSETSVHPKSAPQTPTAAPGRVARSRMRVSWLNPKGVEIWFDNGKPTPEEIDTVKSNGFRFTNSGGKHWWALRTNARAMRFAESIDNIDKKEESDGLTEQQDREGAEFCPSEHHVMA
jgi:hypothetical protein